MADRWDELKHRVAAKRKELEAQIERAKADGIARSHDTRDQARQKLDELNQALKDGWENLSNATAKRLNDWLK